MAGRQVRTLPVPAVPTHRALGDFLAHALPHLDAARLLDLLRRGAIWVGKYRIQEAGYALQGGETVLACFPPTGHYDEPGLDPAQIVFDGDGLLVVDKPSG
jgi:23S rRNA-/tRNA-specific pseudouridylate synthase